MKANNSKAHYTASKIKVFANPYPKADATLFPATANNEQVLIGITAPLKFSFEWVQYQN